MSGSMDGLSETDLRWLRSSFEVARRARRNGNEPFGAVLVDQDGNAILEGENTTLTERDITGHAETNLLREASQRFPPEYLAGCTLYASTEPCVMCAGALYWSGVSRLVYGLSASRFSEAVRRKPATPAVRCRDVLSSGPRRIEVIGPALEDEALQVHLEAGASEHSL